MVYGVAVWRGAHTTHPTQQRVTSHIIRSARTSERRESRETRSSEGRRTPVERVVCSTYTKVVHVAPAQRVTQYQCWPPGWNWAVERGIRRGEKLWWVVAEGVRKGDGRDRCEGSGEAHCAEARFVGSSSFLASVGWRLGGVRWRGGAWQAAAKCE